MDKSAETKKSNAKRILVFILLFAAAVVLVITVVTAIQEKNGEWHPEYRQTDIEAALSDEDYETLFYQTGLGRQAVDKLLRECDSESEAVKTFTAYQNDFFKIGGYRYTCKSVGPFVYEEMYLDDEEKYIEQFEFADIRDGDILVADSNHTVGWRHGHAAIVVDSEEGKVMEAALWGHPSAERNIDKWQAYTKVRVLRIKEDIAESSLKEMGIGRDPGTTADVQLGRLAAGYTEKNCKGVRYRMLSSFHGQKATMTSTQCAHLVWYVYKHFGIDLDGEDSRLITPKDLEASEKLETVQIYGINPRSCLERRANI